MNAVTGVRDRKTFTRAVIFAFAATQRISAEVLMPCKYYQSPKCVVFILKQWKIVVYVKQRRTVVGTQ